MTSISAAAEVRRPRLGVPPAVVVAIAAAWAVALVAEIAGQPGAQHHDLFGGGSPVWVALPLFLVAWQAMIAAMMLPSSLPLIRLFGAASRNQPRPGTAMAAFLGGYALVWTAFGGLAFVADVLLLRAVDAVPWLGDRPWLLAGGALLVAGAFQFSELKDECLSKCRHPGPYLMSRYGRGPQKAFRLGLGHGIFCLGCCWALMLVMLTAGVAVLWWMAALTAVMVYEKVGRHGKALSPAVGIVLITLGGILLLGALLVDPGGGGHHALMGAALG